jgi:hypothetical protein
MNYPKIMATIDGLTEADFDLVREQGAGSRFEVRLDYADGDHHELELHFRLVGPSAARPAEPVIRVEGQQRPGSLQPGRYVGRVTRVGHLPGVNRPEVTLELRDEDTITVGGLNDSGPRFELPARELMLGHLDVSRLAGVLAQLIELSSISPRVLGIPGEGGLLADRIERHLTKDV